MIIAGSGLFSRKRVAHFKFNPADGLLAGGKKSKNKKLFRG